MKTPGALRLVAALVVRLDPDGVPAGVLLRQSAAPGMPFDLPGGRLDPGEYPWRGARRFIAAGEPRDLLALPRLAWRSSQVLALREEARSAPVAFGFIVTAIVGPELVRGLETGHRRTDGGGLLWGELDAARFWLASCPPGLMAALLPVLAGKGNGQWKARLLPVASLWPAETIVATQTNGDTTWQTVAIADA